MTMPSPNGAPPGFLRLIKTGAVGALQASLTFIYPENDAAGGAKKPYVSMDYPRSPGNYPGVWVDFEVSLLQIAGIDHIEMLPDGSVLTRWRFQGYITFTVIALDNSNECDGLYDQVIALTAFAAQSSYPSAFRTAVEENPLVATTWIFDKIEGRGQSSAPGTPWGSDEIVYERGLALQVVGEFVTNPLTTALVDLREIIVTAQPDNEDTSPYIATIS
jgi:hypothetical protein